MNVAVAEQRFDKAITLRIPSELEERARAVLREDDFERLSDLYRRAILEEVKRREGCQ